MKALLKNYRQSPRKVRLIANVIRGKSIPKALTSLSFLEKKAAAPIRKLIESALSNAKREGLKKDELKISDIQVNQGFSFMRYRPRARGQASPIRKRTSHISLTLGKATAPRILKTKRGRKAKRTKETTITHA
ncbi:50S ribosomal protein L22 [Candidatus Kaiserbacteria bacterium]|nr:50S ribosomal protein L22 [Candidatus Kaiserbacteria bacterium]